MIPAGWRLDKVHPCGAQRLVRADGALTTRFPEEPKITDFLSLDELHRRMSQAVRETTEQEEQ